MAVSPLDVSDIDRIQSVIDRSIEPITDSLNQIKSEMRLMMPKADSLDRHQASADRLTNLEKQRNEDFKWALGEHTKMLTEVTTLRSEFGQGRTDVWKYIGMCAGSLLVGGLIDHILHIFGG